MLRAPWEAEGPPLTLSWRCPWPKDPHEYECVPEVGLLWAESLLEVGIA